MIFLALALMLIASPIFAQTPGGTSAPMDLRLPFAYLAMALLPAFAAWDRERSRHPRLKRWHAIPERRRVYGLHSLSDWY